MSPYVVFLLNKALESLRSSNLDSAESYLSEAAKLQKNNPHILRLLGVVSAQKKHHSAAIKYLNNSLKFFPRNALALSNLANVYSDLGDYQKALSTYDNAINIDPTYEEVWTNKGVLLGKINRHNDALYHHGKAIELKPDYAEAWSNKGNILCELEQYEDALKHYDKAISLKPQYAEAWYNKANLLSNLNFLTESSYHYEKAINLNSELDWVYGHLIHSKMKVCDWSSFEEICKNIIQRVKGNKRATHPFPLMSLVDDISLHQQASQQFGSIFNSSKSQLGPITKRPIKEKIRVGYFSPDFHDHPVSHLTLELFKIHDRDKFEIVAVSLHKSPPGDKVHQQLRDVFDKFIEFDERISNQEIAHLCREQEIDIAVDLCGYTKNSRPSIFSFRAAPIQANWLGYPGSFGTASIDYIIADKVVIPEYYKKFYAEKVIWLPDTYMLDDSSRKASSKPISKSAYGLPNDAFVFCCFNNFYKFNPLILDSWARILLRIRNSVIWISENNQQFRKGLLMEFKSRGVDFSRVFFAQREVLIEDHLARYYLADLFLDTFPYNAHTTALDALKTGLPVLTRMGQSFPSRVAASLLNAIGLPELITNSQEDYERMAIELANNPEKLADLKKKLEKNRNIMPLFDTPLFTKNIEAAYLKMYERYHSGLPPDHMIISRVH